MNKAQKAPIKNMDKIDKSNKKAAKMMLSAFEA
jgi:hypothetical protein